MNFSQLHERLRLELLRRIEREVLTATLLARKTGLQQPHISNFLRSKRRLSLPALDRVLASLELSVADLLPARKPAPTRQPGSVDGIPVVSQSTAIHDNLIRPASVLERVQLPPSALARLRAEHGARLPTRERFVAVSLSPEQARPMEPILQPNSLVILDRHSNIPSSPHSLARSIYAVRLHGELHFSYLAFDRNFLILRPHSLAFPVQLLPVPTRTPPSDLVTGRICASLTSL